MSLFDLWWYAGAALIGHALGASARRLVEQLRSVEMRVTRRTIRRGG